MTASNRIRLAKRSRNCRRKNFVHFALEPERDAGFAIVLGRAAIDDDVGNAAPRGQQAETKPPGKPTRWSRARRRGRPPSRRPGRASSSAGSRFCPKLIVAGFKNPPHAQSGGVRCARKKSKCGCGSLRLLQLWHSTSELVPCSSTRRSALVPARLCKPSMFCVTTIRALPALLQPDDRPMNVVRLRVPERLPGFQFVIPMLDSGCFRGHEILVVNRLAPRPDALRSAKIRNAAPGRNSRAGEDQNPSRRAQIIRQSHFKSGAPSSLRASHSAKGT